VLPVGSYALTPRTFFRPELAQGLDETYALCIDGAAQQVHIHDGTIAVQQGEPSTAAVTLQTDISTYLGLLTGQIALDDAIAAGTVRVVGDSDALRRFLRICGMDDALPQSPV
jgi:putative sterol carrier protein